MKQLIFLTLLFFVISLPGLYIDVINPDGINWHTRSYNFTEALLKEHYSDTLQAYHPGITLMWVSGPVLYSLGEYLQSRGFKLYSRDTFLIYDFTAKVCVITVSTILFFLSLFILKKIVNKQFLLLFAVLSIFEPFVLGQRRLYHLDYLTSHFIFVSFLSLYYCFFKSQKLKYLILGCFMFALALLTKSTAVIFLPIPFFMAVLSNFTFKKKLLLIPAIMLFTSVFIYAFLPALWMHPILKIHNVYSKISTGARDIGYLNKKEMGFSGQRPNITLDEEGGHHYAWYYYFCSLAFRFSPFALALILASIIYLFMLVTKGVIYKIKRKDLDYAPDLLLLSLFSFLIITIFFVALTIATKKSERYGVIFFPFLFIIASSFLAKLEYIKIIAISLFLVLTLIPQYIQIYPYFHSYGDPLFGGVKAKYKRLDSSPFGVAIYKVFEAIKADRKGSAEPYSIASSKSLKAIAAGAVYKRTPDCGTDYYVSYAFEPMAYEACGRHYTLIKTIKVGNMNYWYIFKNLAPRNELAPEI